MTLLLFRLLLPLLLLLMFTAQETTGNYFDSNCLFPHDPFVFIGENVTLNCNSTNSSNSLYFTWKSDINISSKYQRVISPSVLQLNMPVSNQSFDDVIFTCWDNLDYDLFCSQRLSVEYPPRKMNNVTVLVDNGNTMNISWTMPHYIYPAKVKVDVIWTASGAEYWYYCSESSNYHCYLNQSDFKNSIFYYFNITVSINNSHVHRRYIQHEKVKTSHYIRILPVELLGFNKTSRSVTLKWAPPKKYFTSLWYRITVSLKDQEILSRDVRETSDTVLHLRPNSLYRFSISVKLQSSIYWSHPVSIDVRTDEDKPDGGVVVTEGGFYVKEGCSRDRRRMIIFLTPPDEEKQNGNLTSYNITYAPINGGIKWTNQQPATSHYDIADIACSLDYDVYLSVSNKMGVSPVSKIRVPRHASVSGPRQVRVRITDNGDQLQWATTGTSSELPTVYWCKKRKLSPLCKSQIRWKQESASQNWSSVVYDDEYMYGVSLTTDSGSSGVVWADCIYKLEKAPSGTPKLLAVQPFNLGLTVRWVSDQCVDNVLVTEYVLQYCINNNTDCVSKLISSEKNRYDIMNLKEDVKYYVRLKERSVAGKEGRYCKPLIGIPVFHGFRMQTLYYTISGCIVAVFLIFTVFYKKVLTKRDVIEMPATVSIQVKDPIQNGSADNGAVTWANNMLSGKSVRPIYTTGMEKTCGSMSHDREKTYCEKISRQQYSTFSLEQICLKNETSVWNGDLKHLTENTIPYDTSKIETVDSDVTSEDFDPDISAGSDSHDPYVTTWNENIDASAEHNVIAANEKIDYSDRGGNKKVDTSDPAGNNTVGSYVTACNENGDSVATSETEDVDSSGNENLDTSETA